MSQSARRDREPAPARPTRSALRSTCTHVLAPALAVLGVALLAGGQAGLAPQHLLRDPLADLGVPAVTGALSWLGVLAMAGTAALLAGAAAVCGRTRPGGDDGRFLASSAAAVALLCLDDAFQLHETLLPHVGVPELLAYAAYACGAMAYLGRWRRHLLHRTEVAVLGLAAALLGGSLLVDLLALEVSAGSTIVEDVPKLLGIATLAAYFVRAAAVATLPTPVPVASVAAPARIGSSLAHGAADDAAGQRPAKTLGRRRRGGVGAAV